MGWRRGVCYAVLERGNARRRHRVAHKRIRNMNLHDEIQEEEIGTETAHNCHTNHHITITASALAFSSTNGSDGSHLFCGNVGGLLVGGFLCRILPLSDRCSNSLLISSNVGILFLGTLLCNSLLLRSCPGSILLFNGNTGSLLLGGFLCCIVLLHGRHSSSFPLSGNAGILLLVSLLYNSLLLNSYSGRNLLVISNAGNLLFGGFLCCILLLGCLLGYPAASSTTSSLAAFASATIWVFSSSTLFSAAPCWQPPPLPPSCQLSLQLQARRHKDLYGKQLSSMWATQWIPIITSAPKISRRGMRPTLLFRMPALTVPMLTCISQCCGCVGLKARWCGQSLCKGFRTWPGWLDRGG